MRYLKLQFSSINWTADVGMEPFISVEIIVDVLCLGILLVHRGLDDDDDDYACYFLFTVRENLNTYLIGT